MTDNRASLRRQLDEGDVEHADRAMSLLLDVSDPSTLDQGDVVRALEAIERLGTPARSRMFETFLLLVSRWPEVTVPALIRYIERSPLSWTARLAFAAIDEVLESVPNGRARIDRDAVVRALVRVIDAAAEADWKEADLNGLLGAVRSLRDWSEREPIPESGPALTRLLLRAAGEPHANEKMLRLAAEAFLRNGQAGQIALVQARARPLPRDHPLRRALASIRPEA